MGWFWSDSGVPTLGTQPVATSSSRTQAQPPPECPMHVAASRETGTPSSASCPVSHSPQSTTQASSTTRSTLSKLNPLNYMPSLSQDRMPGQVNSLPTLREVSSIPRGDANSNWEYPSPQQMYNALRRKGFEDTPENAIESMVAVHNFLNEGAWDEIVGWERRFADGLRSGWDNCIEGEERFEAKHAQEEAHTALSSFRAPKLARLQGRPQDLTPKARILQLLGWAYPKKFAAEPPFDRHDWFVQRALPDGSRREVRYVIDYYSGPPEPTGEPVFYLDVRPALDSPSAVMERLMRFGGDVWFRASGGQTRVDPVDVK